MFGVTTYKPKFHTTSTSFKIEFQKTLSKLIGKKIKRFWVLWDTKKNEWLSEGPVVLEIDGKRFEFTAFQLDQFSLTTNSFELTDKLDWYGMGDKLPLTWKENAKLELARNLDKPIVGINILTYYSIHKMAKGFKKSETIDLLTGIEFVLEKESDSDNKNFFSIYNGLGENNLAEFQIQDENHLKRISLVDFNSKEFENAHM